MRISEKEWENIDFRKKKYRQLKAALDEAVTGRDNKVSAFVLCEDGRYSTEALDRLVDELIKSMDEYGNRHNMWLKALGMRMRQECLRSSGNLCRTICIVSFVS